jgi:hypothetical protein
MIWLKSHWGWGVALTSLVVVLLAFGVTRWTERGDAMSSVPESVAPAEIPAIDLVQPERTELATFAMG